MIYDKISMGNRIRIARLTKDITQLEIADKLNMSQSNYSNIENGNQDISVPQLIDIANVLDVSAAWLLGENIIAGLTDIERLEVENFIKYLISKRK